MPSNPQKQLALILTGTIGAAITSIAGAPTTWNTVFQLVFAAVSCLGALWAYYDAVPFKMQIRKDMITKNANGDYGYFIAGSTHKKGLYPKVTLRCYTDSGDYVEAVSSTRYLGNGDLEIDAYPQDIDVEIRP